MTKQIGPLVCFDLGNVLIKLGPPIHLYARADCRAEVTSLLELYSLGQLSTNAFYERLQCFMVWPMSRSELQEAFVYTRLPGFQNGSEALIEELSALGLELAVLSNINEAHWQYLQKLKVFRHFKHAFLSFELGIKKPHDDIYKLVERETLRCGRDIVFFDDREENVLSARRCGWSAFQVPPDNIVVAVRRNLAGLGLL
ncbi:hypothetical protein PI87_19725 [Ralstonia sp. A12]|uniref:HAD-IA family hydrolase n=1 Tax=Ralstonia sp. A12 TaxID=1217052 RepID=UPI000575A821|nr:HAD-IA family hydrolase [Ralstonia sp. A12]KHK52067.1 hypothetical protein PI87_19725 [Ralstonia sp. A12]